VTLAVTFTATKMSSSGEITKPIWGFLLKQSACSLVNIDQLSVEMKQALFKELASELGFILHPVTHTSTDFQRPLISLTLADVLRSNQPSNGTQPRRSGSRRKGKAKQDGID
jgi:hypothetical protein